MGAIVVSTHTPDCKGYYSPGCLACQAQSRVYRERQLTHATGRLVRRQANWRTQGINVTEATKEFQKNKTACDICGQPADGRGALHIDHNHSTGHVRGSLCSSHNRMLGYAGDDPAVLRAAADYLEFHDGKSQ